MDLIFVALMTSLLSIGCFGKLPSDLIPCQYEDTLCVRRTANDLITNYSSGRPDLGLLPLDPLRIESIVMNQGDNRTFSFDLCFKDVEVRGISGLQFERAVGFGKTPARSKFELYAKVPKLEITGNYIASGRIMFLPIEGNGEFRLVVENIIGGLKFKPRIVEVNGNEYLKIEKIKIRIEPERARIDLKNLFNGDKQLSAAILEFLNQNWDEVWQEVSAPIVEIAEKQAKEILQNIFDKNPYKDFFSDS